MNFNEIGLNYLNVHVFIHTICHLFKYSLYNVYVHNINVCLYTYLLVWRSYQCLSTLFPQVSTNQCSTILKPVMCTPCALIPQMAYFQKDDVMPPDLCAGKVCVNTILIHEHTHSTSCTLQYIYSPHTCVQACR